MKQLHALLFAQKEKQVAEKRQKKLDSRYEETGTQAREGDLVLMRQNNKIGTLSEIRGKKAIVKFGVIPITVEYSDLVTVKMKEEAD
jgi:DNA mismatch repair protein MutS2